MYKVIQHRTTRGRGDIPAVVWSGNRRRLARGEAKSHLHSALEMIMHHDFFDADDFDLDEANYRITLYQGNSNLIEILSIWYEIEGMEPEKPRIPPWQCECGKLNAERNKECWSCKRER